jgi:DNA-binding NtrC family response regulator
MSIAPSFPVIVHNAARETGGALIATPSHALREHVLANMNGRWRPVHHALGGAEALVKLEEGNWQVLFLDRRLPDLDSGELAAIVQRRFPGLQVIEVDSDAPPGDRKQELDDDSEFHQGSRFHGASAARSATAGETDARIEMRPEYEPLPGMIGRSAAMQRVYRLARLVAPRSTTVLIAGPTGSGKELVARALHALSPRSARPFVAVNCAAIPEALLESELFGYARGAFTGAVQAQNGRIAAAHGGTLFFDEISEMPLGMQAKLLRFLEQKEVQRLGTAEVARVDVRVIAASNVDLAGRAGRGEFREDLFYRLSTFPLELPPLAERQPDIIPLAEHFLACMAAAMSSACPRLSAEAVQILEAHPWKGNVRELQHVMERASILVENGDTVLSEHLYFPFQHVPFPRVEESAGVRPLPCASRAS